MKLRWFAVWVLTLVTASRPSLAAEGPKWFEASSEHFLLFTDTSQEKARRLLVDLEARIAALSEALGKIPPRQFPIEIFLFNKSEDFTEALPRPPRATSAAPPVLDKTAYLLRGPDRVFIVAKDKPPEDIAADAGHALGHVLFERKVMWRPFWLAEAAAEYFRKIGRNADTKKISEEEGFSASDLLTIAPSATYNDDEPGGAFRLQSYRLLRIILDDKPQLVRDYFEVLRTEDGAKAKINIDAQAFEARLKSYVETPLKAPSVLAAAKGAEADSARLAIHRGDLLFATDRGSEAAKWYNADSNEARAARAIQTRYSRLPGEAARILDRAARELPEFGLVQFHFGALELTNPKDIGAQAAALERAVKLLPQFGRAHAELARVYALRGKAGQALPLVTKALELEPEFADRSYGIRGEVLLALGQYDEAFRAMDLAASLPHADRSAGERYAVELSTFKRKIDNARREIENRRLEQLRREVAAEVRAREPEPKPTPPPPPVPDGRITYEIEARSPIKVVEAVYPEYPEALRKAGTAGTITLRVEVDADGRVKNASVMSSQAAVLNAATLEAVKRWSFNPAQRAGTTRTIRVIFNYSLQ